VITPVEISREYNYIFGHPLLTNKTSHSKKKSNENISKRYSCQR
jgi:hypothetical protein